MASNSNYFWLRRVHSLLGIVPIGAFVFEHFFSNSYVFQGADQFNKMVENLQGLPLVLFLEIGLIAAPLLLHVILGFVIMFTGSVNVGHYNKYRNWMYVLQRVTGMIAFIFIGYHVYTTRISAGLADQLITYTDMQHLLAPTWAKWFYIIGIVSVIFHLSNGIATSLMTWGITVSQAAQRRASIVCWGIFVAMTFWGIKIVFAFA
ncbi:MAG: succinate dehydrogenase [Deltaproteobacteria bacterium CG11_big_fil_rev_8_21_14_0_20_47_16]|nr:MAG: succinate dehydrogenase [Deltaproteobacteria bacterium CG11_big_fil_rev_8_21_14_0_20_47_16]